MNETNRPAYADYDAPRKFDALIGIIATRLSENPKAICSYSGGSDSDILIDLIESTRKMIPTLPDVDYVFFNTGLEMKATKDHVRATEKKYNVKIREVRPKINIIQAVRKNGVPFMSKLFSEEIGRWQRSDIPLAVVDEFQRSNDKSKEYNELRARYKNSRSTLCFLLSCTTDGQIIKNQHTLNSAKYLKEFMQEFPPDFLVSAKCCDYCKKQVAHTVQKNYEMIITGERLAEGGVRSISARITNRQETPCFFEQANGQKRFRPLYYVSESDKEWYKQEFGIRYSDAYEVYGLKRTGCCGCPIAHSAVEDLALIEPHEPNVVKAAWAIFGDSYRYRKKYEQYKAERMAEDKRDPAQVRMI